MRSPMETIDPLLGQKLVTLRAIQWIMGLRDDPYALFLRAVDDDTSELGRRIRERGELYRSHTGAWVTARHATARELLADRRLIHRAPVVSDQQIPTLRGVLPLAEAWADCTASGAGAEPPEIEAREIEGLNGEFDLAAVARRLAVRVTAGALGVADEQEFAEACAGAAGLLDATVCPPSTPTAYELLRSVAVLRELAYAAIGVELTTNLICNTVAALLDSAGRWTDVGRDPKLTTAAISETLRWAPPVRLYPLFAQTDLTLAGHHLQPGDEVVVAVGAAERDLEVYPDPDRFDLHRPSAERLLPPPPLRTAEAAVGALAAGLPDLHRTGPALRRLRSPITAGIVRFPVAS
jgi:P450-derived glycosyltransferase activator